MNLLPRSRLEDLLPQAADGSSYLPPASEGPSKSSTSWADVAKADSLVRRPKELQDRIEELQIENGLAFRILNRTGKDILKSPRLAYMRKFFEGLAHMACYWDCSLDDYFVRAEDSGAAHLDKRQRLDEPFAQNSGMMLLSDEDSVSTPASRAPSSSTSDFQTPNSSLTTASSPSQHNRYKGRRTSTGRDMPDEIRADTVQAFVAGVLFSFHSKSSRPQRIPRVQIGKVGVPVREERVVYRIPKDRTRARQGCLVGPVMGILTRPETNFSKDETDKPVDTVTLDLLRELGALLYIAQERHREGRTEEIPGKGRWWTTKPRWGGGKGGEAPSETGNTDEMDATNDLTKAAKRSGLGSRDRGLRTTPAMLWKELKCGKSPWEPSCDYAAIGKESGQPYDEVFLVSSLNHHISILKLTVHSAYLDFLESAILPSPLPDDAEWCRPKLERSQWYDLFDVEDRVALFRGLWGVFTYLTRDLDSAPAQGFPGIQNQSRPPDGRPG